MSDFPKKPALPPIPRPGSNPDFGQEHDRAWLNAKLRAYLEEHEQDKIDGNTIANLRLEVHHIRMTQDEQGNEIQALKLRADRHGKAIREIKTRMDRQADQGPIGGFEYDTGVHQLEDLKKHLAKKEEELKERRDSVWWRRTKVTWVATGIGFTIASALGGVGTILWYLLTHGAK